MRRNHIHHGRDVGIFTFDNGLVSFSFFLSSKYKNVQVVKLFRINLKLIGKVILQLIMFTKNTLSASKQEHILLPMFKTDMGTILTVQYGFIVCPSFTRKQESIYNKIVEYDWLIKYFTYTNS